MSLPARICLNMIVKDESAIIERCLASVLPLIDHYVICDTGSSDDTPEKIAAFFARHGIPGEVPRIPFVDFATARNRALELCRGSAGDFSYILLTDADMELVLEEPGVKERLSAPAYRVRQANRISYDNVRLIRRDLAARYVGATHEYLDTGSRTERLEGIWFQDHACGSSRAVKIARDIALLEGALRSDPGDARSMFYLAQSYKESGRYADAAEWYARRIAAGGWDEEVWHARFMRARCLLELGRKAEFVQASMEAYEARPTRAEPLYELARHYRLEGMNEACMLLSEAGAVIPYPRQDLLFIDDQAYRTGFLEEMSICGYYCGDQRRRQRGYEACMALAVSRKAEDVTRWTARRNAAYYARSAAELFGHCLVHDLLLPLESTYAPANPSLCRHQDTWYGIIRAVNYSLEQGRYHIHDERGVIRSRNFFVRLGDELDVVESRELLELPPEPPRSGFPVEGFEDCRLFHCRGRFWCSATVRDRTSTGRCEIALLELDDERRVVRLDVERSVGADRHQKNWVPLVCGDDLFFIYLTDPTIVLAYDFATRSARIVSEGPPPLALEHLRGGSQAVAVAGGWLYLTHEVAVEGPADRTYLHRLVLLAVDFSVKAASDPFYFLAKGVEFCAGAVVDAEGNRLIASVGIGDKRAVIAQLPLDTVLAHLGRKDAGGQEQCGVANGQTGFQE